MQRILLSWIGQTDLITSAEYRKMRLGPIAQVVTSRQYDQIHLIADYPEEELHPYLDWLQSQTTAQITLYRVELTSPVDFEEIYEAVVAKLEELHQELNSDLQLSFHLSAGTPAMAAVWIVLARTRFLAELIESSRQHGVRTVSVPFDISPVFISDLLRGPDEKLEQLSTDLPSDMHEFSSILYSSKVMERTIEKAKIAAARSVPVLIKGEIGTGKEMLARAIHSASPRRGGPFVPVYCGEFPPDLLEAKLFGHVKGAYRGVTNDHPGFFETAAGGTLFIHDVELLPLPTQAKLLQTLREKNVSRMDTTTGTPIDVRIIIATSRNLFEAISAGEFKKRLYDHLSVIVLNIPPLRERTGDVGLLADALMKRVNEESTEEPGYRDKELSADAKNLIQLHFWPGNVTELFGAIRQAAIFSSGTVISREQMQDSIIPMSDWGASDILDRPLGERSNLPDLIEIVAAHYLSRALEETDRNKTKAATLVSLPNYQTFTNWMKKYGVN